MMLPWIFGKIINVASNSIRFDSIEFDGESQLNGHFLCAIKNWVILGQSYSRELNGSPLSAQ